MSAMVGDVAPDFELPATGPKENVRLSDLRGKPVVLLFYPLDFSGKCTTELCGIRDGLTEYEHLGAQVLAVSVDSIFAHRAFAQANGFSFPLLSDFQKTTMQAYGAFNADRGFAKRSAFVIDKDGVIRYREVSETNDIPNFEAVQEAVSRAG